MNFHDALQTVISRFTNTRIRRGGLERAPGINGTRGRTIHVSPFVTWMPPAWHYVQRDVAVDVDVDVAASGSCSSTPELAKGTQPAGSSAVPVTTRSERAGHVETELGLLAWPGDADRQLRAAAWPPGREAARFSPQPPSTTRRLGERGVEQEMTAKVECLVQVIGPSDLNHRTWYAKRQIRKPQRTLAELNAHLPRSPSPANARAGHASFTRTKDSTKTR